MNIRRVLDDEQSASAKASAGCPPVRQLLSDPLLNVLGQFVARMSTDDLIAFAIVYRSTTINP